MSVTKPSSQNSEKHGIGSRKFVEPGRMKESKERRTGKQSRTNEHTEELTETVAACTGPAYFSSRWGPSTEWGSGNKLPCLTQSLCTNDNYSNKKLVFSNVVSVGVQTNLKHMPHVQQ